MIEAGDGQALLKGVKVVDLTAVVFGPFATQILADLGADVVKVETPTGDAFRYAGKPAVTPGLGPSFMALNRGKRSIILDLKQPDDLQVMKDMLTDADVFALNVRGKAVERLGLDYESVKAINPDIIYAHCVGFGQDGPYADLQAYDDVIQAATGTTTLLGRVDGDPTPRFLPSLIADKVAGLHGAYAILAAIIHRMRTGRGQCVEIPMMEAFSNFMLLEHLGGLTYDPPNGDVGYFRQLDPDRQPFPTSDGHISLVPYTDPSLPLLFEVLGDPLFLTDPKFASARERFANMRFIYRRIAELTPNFTTAKLLNACHEAQIPAQAVRDLNDILDEPHLSATGFFKRRTHPTEGDYFEMKPPIAFGDAETIPGHFPPRLGEQSDDVREEFNRRNSERSKG
jgi:crotonobetainyl-CoA:carnitine CoA-transferase CaiB-like acyl-CoA transferase